MWRKLTTVPEARLVTLHSTDTVPCPNQAIYSSAFIVDYEKMGSVEPVSTMRVKEVNHDCRNIGILEALTN